MKADKATGWTIRGSNSGSGKRFFSFPKRTEWICGSCSIGTGGYFPGGDRVKRSDREVDHSTPSNRG
jgi:hypothetical protein